MSLFEDLDIASKLNKKQVDEFVDLLGSLTEKKDLFELTWTEERKENLAFVKLYDFFSELLVESKKYEEERKRIFSFLERSGEENPSGKLGADLLIYALENTENYLLLYKEKLVKDTSSCKIEEVSSTIDLRPIFSLDRSSIVKSILVHRIEITTKNGSSNFEIYENDLDEIIEEMIRAKRKAELVKSMSMGLEQ